MGKLPSTAFGYGWGGFVEEGGDIRPFAKQALAYLVDKADAERLLVCWKMTMKNWPLLF